MAYHLEGHLLEVCTCGAHCPCRPTGAPDGGSCAVVNAWHVDEGTVDDTDVSGLTLIALSHVHGHVLAGRPVVYYVDDQATEAQQAALLRAWTGQAGGPLADMARLIGEVAGMEQAPITFAVQRGKGHLQVGKAMAAQITTASGTSGHAITHPGRDICTTLPGETTQPAQATTYQVTFPAYGFLLDLHDYPVVIGRFRFEG